MLGYPAHLVGNNKISKTEAWYGSRREAEGDEGAKGMVWRKWREHAGRGLRADTVSPECPSASSLRSENLPALSS